MNLGIDEKLENNVLDIVNKIAKVKISDNKEINYYSFATKYCSFHKPEIYPIYDSFIEKILMNFKNDKFRFDNSSPKVYKELKFRTLKPL